MKRNLIRLLIGFTIICAVTSCRLPGDAPQPPDHGRRGSLSAKYKKLRVLDLKTGKHYNDALSNPDWEGAECMPIDDAIEYETWVDSLETWAATHCQ